MQTNTDIKIDTDQETYIASNHNACVYIDLYFIRGIVTSLFIDLYIVGCMGLFIAPPLFPNRNYL